MSPRERGTPQGGVISPAAGQPVPALRVRCLDRADDARRDVRALRRRHHLPLPERARGAGRCGAPLTSGSPRAGWCSIREKTKLVYCKDTNRTGEHDCISFDFLGYTFRPRLAKWRGGLYGVSFLPAASPKALKAIRQRGARLVASNAAATRLLDDLARMFNPYIRGWIGYYSHFYKSALYPTLRRIDAHVLRWVARKFKRFRQRPRGARDWLARLIRAQRRTLCPLAASVWSRPDAGSRMSREAHVRFWERAGVRFPRATRLPLYRQAQILARQGIEIGREVLAGWVGTAAAEIAPVVRAAARDPAGLAAAVRRRDHDAGARPRPRPGRKKGFAWAIARDDRPWGGTDPPAVVFHYAPGRGASHPKALLAGYRGILQCDGYAAYKTAGRRPAAASPWRSAGRMSGGSSSSLAKGKTAPIADRGAAAHRRALRRRGRGPRPAAGGRAAPSGRRRAGRWSRTCSPGSRRSSRACRAAARPPRRSATR